MSWFTGLNKKLTASFKSSSDLGGKATDLVNLYPNSKRELVKINFKTFRGLISELRKANKNCKKYKCQTEIRILLPLRGN